MRLRLKFSLFLSVFTLISFNAVKADALLLLGSKPSLFDTTRKTDSIIAFDETSGTFLGEFTRSDITELVAPDDLTFGPDGDLYVSVGGDSGGNVFSPDYPKNSAILRFSPTGEFKGVFAASDLLKRPYGNAFGPDGNLYVASFRTNQILRFDGNTGQFLDVFASDNNNGFGAKDGLNGPNGLLFDRAGNLYVTTQGSANKPTGDLDFPFASQVLRYSRDQVDGKVSTQTPEVFIDQPPTAPGADFVSLLGLELAPDEKSLFVSDFAGGIRQYDFTGQLLNLLSTNYAAGGNFVGSIAFGYGSNTLYALGFDLLAGKNLIGSVLAFDNAQGSPTAFTGELFTDPSLVRPIGIVAAVPEPATIAGAALALSGLGAARLRKQRK